jgi:subtilase family serine protease
MRKIKFVPQVDILEERSLLSSLTQFEKYYGFNYSSNPASKGAGTTIAIVDAYDYSSLSANLIKFSRHEKLPTANLNIFNLGQGTGTASNAWANEVSVDVDLAHLLAPLATIDLVEAASNAGQDMVNADNYALSLPGVTVISNSWVISEFPAESQVDYNLTSAVLVAGTGDSGTTPYYPSVLPDVVAVGGTSLFHRGNKLKETDWSGGGSGPSLYIPNRTVPDVSMNAGMYPGLNYYYNGFYTSAWGTSSSAVIFASLVTIGQAERTQIGLLPMGGSLLLSIMRSNPQDFHSIIHTSGLGSPNPKFLSLFV